MKKPFKMSQLQGTSCTITYLHRAEGDSVRDKRRCRYYEDGRCSHRLYTCCGSSHCQYYKEWVNGEKLGEQRRKVYEKGKLQKRRVEIIKKETGSSLNRRSHPSHVYVPYKTGDYLYHSVYKVGRITEISGSKITLDFEGQIKSFIYPNIFESGHMQAYKLGDCPYTLGECIEGKRFGIGYIEKLSYTHSMDKYVLVVKYFAKEQAVQQVYPEHFV